MKVFFVGIGLFFRATPKLQKGKIKKEKVTFFTLWDFKVSSIYANELLVLIFWEMIRRLTKRQKIIIIMCIIMQEMCFPETD